MESEPINRAALSTVVAIITISGLAFTLIAIVIARSPYTHGNLSPAGYHRTEVALVGDERPFEGLELADPRLAQTGDPIQDGRVLFFRYGCASCHGFQGEGATVGKDLEDASPSEIRREVRDGPEGMPAFAAPFLSDEDLDKIVAFLRSDPTAQSARPGPEITGQPTDVLPDPDPKGRSLLEKIGALLTRALDRVAAESRETTRWRSQ